MFDRRRILGLDRGLEQNHGSAYLTEELNYKFSAECPCLGRKEKSIILIHVVDLIFRGCSKYIKEIFLPKTQDRFVTSVNKIARMGDEFNFLCNDLCNGKAIQVLGKSL